MDEWIKKGKVVQPSDLLAEFLTHMKSRADHVYQDKSSLENVLEQARQLVPKASI
jgi:hypothetical protein